MRLSYEELKKVFLKENLVKSKIKKFFKIVGVFAIALFLLAVIYKDVSDGFSINFFGIFFIIISFVIAIAIAQEGNKSATIFKSNIANVNNYLINRFDFKLKNDLMIKQVGKVTYSFEYDLGVMTNKNIIRKEELNNPQEFCVCMICKMYNISHMEYCDLDNFMKERTTEIIMVPEEKSVKIIGEFSNLYKPEEILFFMCQKLEYFEANLKKTLEKEKSPSDIEFEKKMLNVLGKEKTEDYVSLSTSTNAKEKSESCNQINFSKSDFKQETIHGKNVTFKNYKDNSLLRKIFRNVLIGGSAVAVAYLTFYISRGYNFQSKFTAILAMLALILISLPYLLEEMLLPSYVLTKMFGLKEQRGERFYGTLSNGVPFCVKPYKSKRFFKNGFPSASRLHRMRYFTQAKLKVAVEIEKIENYLSKEEILFITQNNNVEQKEGSLILYEEVQNADVKKEEMLEENIGIILKKLAIIFGIYDENIILEKENKYNAKAMCFNMLNRCFDKVTFVFYVILSIYTLYLFGTMLYTFVLDFMRLL